MSVIPYERYKADLIRLGASHIPSEEEYNAQYCKGVEEYVPMIITPRNQKRPIKATFENSDMGTIKKKKGLIASTVRGVISESKKRRAVERKEEAVKPQAIKAPKIRKPRVRQFTDEEIKERRKAARAAKREVNKKLGLTVDGKPRKIFERKKELTIEEQRERRRRYAKTYRTNHREQHLAQRKRQRQRRRERELEKIQSTPPKQSVCSAEVSVSEAAA